MKKTNYLTGVAAKRVAEGNHVRILAKDGIVCPCCKEILIRWGFEKRILKTCNAVQTISSQRLYCKNCHRVFHIYPEDLILPKIRFSPVYYNKAVSEDAICLDCEACDSTQNRWRKKAKEAKQKD